MQAWTGPAFTRNGRAATSPVSIVSAWIRKRPVELLPTSIPSPLLRREHVSTHTRSPRPRERSDVIFARTRWTFCGNDSRRARTARTSSGEEGVKKMPSAPTSIVSKTSFASAASWTSTSNRVPLPWKYAMRFSRGITFQGSSRTTTCFVAPRMARTRGSSFAERIVASRPTSASPRTNVLPFRRIGEKRPSRGRDSSGLERFRRCRVRRLNEVGTELGALAGRVLHHLDVVGIPDGRPTRVHHREERDAEAIAIRRRGPEVFDHAVVVLTTEVHVNADRVRAVGDRLLDARHRDLAIRPRAQRGRCTQMQDECQSLVEIIFRKSNGPFVEDDRRRAALRHVRHGPANVSQSRNRSGGDTVVHRGDQRLAVAEDPPHPNLLSNGGQRPFPRVLQRSRRRTSPFYLVPSVDGERHMPAKIWTTVRSSFVPEDTLAHAMTASGDLRRTSCRISMSSLSGSGTDISTIA